MISKVRFYKREKFYGFTEYNGESVYINARQIVDGFNFLNSNDLIEYEVTKNNTGGLRAAMVKVLQPNLYTRTFAIGNTPPSDFEQVFKHISINPQHVGRDFVRHTAWLAGRTATTSLLFLEGYHLKKLNNKEFSTSYIPWSIFLDNLYHACRVNPWWVEEVKAVGLEKLIGG